MRTKPIISAKQLTPLIEIILALVFFAITSTILVRVFSRAHNDSRLAHDINSATLFVGECAEKIKTADSLDAISALLTHSGFVYDAKGGGYRADLDSGFNSISDAAQKPPAAASSKTAYVAVAFEIKARETGAGRLVTGRFVCTRYDGVELIRIDTAVILTVLDG